MTNAIPAALDGYLEACFYYNHSPVTYLFRKSCSLQADGLTTKNTEKHNESMEMVPYERLQYIPVNFNVFR
jgi:hypothetical protein